MSSTKNPEPHDNQNSDSLGNQETPKSEPVPGDVRCDVVENWWAAPISNRLTAAFHVGRLLNQLNWHLQHFFFFNRPVDETMIDEVLSRVVAVSYNFVSEPPNRLEVEITKFRQGWKGHLHCEAVGDECYAYSNDCERDLIDETAEEHRQYLVETWITPLLEKLEKRISPELSERELWTLFLGKCLDCVMRRSDVYRFFVEELVVREDSGAAKPSVWPGLPLECEWELRTPSRIKPDTASVHKLQVLLAKTGMPALNIEIPTTPTNSGSQDLATQISHVVESLDHDIRGRLGACKDESNGMNPPGPTPGNSESHRSLEDKSAAAKDAASQHSEPMSLEARALACLIDHSDWTNTKIAKELGCGRTTLYRFKKYMAARKQLKESGKESQLQGNKVDGNIEAWAR